MSGDDDAATIVGNLDCEVEWAGGGPLPLAVRRKLGAAATLLRALVPDGTTAKVQTMAPVDPARLPEVAGSPVWSMSTLPDRPAVTGREENAQPICLRRLAWGASDSFPSSSGGEGSASASRKGSSWRQHLLDLPLSSVAIARAASDRRRLAAWAEAMGCPLPGVRTITSLDELDEHLRRGGAGETNRWVVKAPLAAAGRERALGRGAQLDDESRRHVANLLRRHDALVFEPWLDRRVDLGQPAILLGDGQVCVLPPHLLHCDHRGEFRGVTIPVGNHWLDAAIRDQLAATATAVAGELARLGYRGPFVVDAFLHHTHGAIALRPLVEVNPRLSFGLVARAWAERLGHGVTLRLGRGAPPTGSIALVAPAADDATSAWLEPSPAPALDEMARALSAS